MSSRGSKRLEELLAEVRRLGLDPFEGRPDTLSEDDLEEVLEQLLLERELGDARSDGRFEAEVRQALEGLPGPAVPEVAASVAQALDQDPDLKPRAWWDDLAARGDRWWRGRTKLSELDEEYDLHYGQALVFQAGEGEGRVFPVREVGGKLEAAGAGIQYGTLRSYFARIRRGGGAA